MSTVDTSPELPSVKEHLRAMLTRLPDDCSIEDVQYELYVIEKIRRGLASLDRGEGIPHEEVKRRMEKWLTK
jgi:predicted transcriptional regulator